MTSKGNKNKSDFLGMPHGTARNRLVKRLLFRFISLLKLDTCFVCGKELTLDTFSIEHKQPWLYESTDLFWDLDNIAFSHKKCNRQRSRRTEICIRGHRKTLDSKGKSYCRECNRQFWHDKKYTEKRRERNRLAD
jgi:hypothetical protein